MVIEICTCGHPDGRHVVARDGSLNPTDPREGTCYDCRCQLFTEQVRLAQLVSHREHHDDIAILLGLDTQGRLWWWYDPDDEWQVWTGTFVFTPNVNTEKKP